MMGSAVRLQIECLDSYATDDWVWAIVDPVYLNRLNFKDEQFSGEIVPLFRERQDAEDSLSAARANGSRRFRVDACYTVIQVPLVRMVRALADKKSGLATVLYEAGSKPTRVAP